MISLLGFGPAVVVVVWVRAKGQKESNLEREVKKAVAEYIFLH